MSLLLNLYMLYMSRDEHFRKKPVWQHVSWPTVAGHLIIQTHTMQQDMLTVR